MGYWNALFGPILSNFLLLLLGDNASLKTCLVGKLCWISASLNNFSFPLIAPSLSWAPLRPTVRLSATLDCLLAFTWQRWVCDSSTEGPPFLHETALPLWDVLKHVLSYHVSLELQNGRAWKPFKCFQNSPFLFANEKTIIRVCRRTDPARWVPGERRKGRKELKPAMLR